MNALQNKIPRGMLSMPSGRCGCRIGSPRIVAPVVVNPDMDSKNASVKEGILPDSKKGRVANRAMVAQPRVTIANPSLLVR
jgi:hypothetical protein